jgi:PAS domain S-box-containing protein
MIGCVAVCVCAILLEARLDSVIMEDVRTLASQPGQAPSESTIPVETLSSDAVLDALRMIFLDAPLHEVLTNIIRLIEAHSSGMLCSIFLLSEDGTHLKCAAAPSLPEAYCDAIDRLDIGPTVASCGTAAYPRQPVFVSDVASDPKWANLKGLALPNGVRAAWSSPIMSHSGKVLGTFHIHYGEVRHPGQGEIHLIDCASRIAGIAIESKRSHVALQNALVEIKCSQNRLQMAIDTIPALAWAARLDGSAEFFNQHYLHYVGLPAEQMRDGGWTVAVHPDDLNRLAGSWQFIMASGKQGECEARLRRFDGEYRWFLFRVNPLRDEFGNIVKWFGVNTDIEDRKRAEETLRRSEHDLLEAQRLSHTGSWKHHIQSGTVTVSPEIFRIFGVQPDEDISAPDFWLRRRHPDDQKHIQELFESCETEKKDYEAHYRIVLPGGAIKHLHTIGHPILNELGDLVEFTGTTIDITEYKEAEEKLRQSEREARQLLDLSPVHISEMGPDGVPLHYNQVALAYHGITLEEWKSTSHRWWSVPVEQNMRVHPQDAERFVSEIPNKFLAGFPFELEVRLRRKDGQYRWFHFRINPMRDEQGRITRWYSVGTDIDDRKKAEERTRNENLALREQIDRDSMFEDIVGSSEALGKVLGQVAKLAASDSTVLILGETGTGKELIARAIHKRSNRAERAFIAVNCAAIPPSLVASELFGFEKGAFTGATQGRAGRFESANGGTIFLDEVGDLPQEVQIALLRVLQEREIERVGRNKPIPVDVRVLSATHRDLDALVAEGKFRQDLLYRLNVVPIELPPLRERVADIPLLVEYYIDRFGKKSGKKFRTIDKQTLTLLQAYSWPGNIRELQNVIERAIILSDGDTFSVDETWFKREPTSRVAGPTVALEDALLSQEKEMIEAALTESHGRISGPAGAAAKLALPAQTLEAKIKRLGINKFRFKVPHVG